MDALNTTTSRTVPWLAHMHLKAIPPLEPIGVCQRHVLLRDAAGAVLVLPLRKLTRRGIAALFASRPEALREFWPATRAAGWNHHNAMTTIIYLCSKRGVADPKRFGFEPVYRWRPDGASNGYWKVSFRKATK